MTSKLEIIADAAIATGNEPPSQEWESSMSWRIGHPAYERAVKIAFSRADWKFARMTRVLSRTGSSTIPGFTDRFARPADFLYMAGLSDATSGAGLEWVYQDGEIHTKQGAALATYYAAPVYETWPALFVEAVSLFVEAAYYRAREDHQVAQAREDKAERRLMEAATRTDQELGQRSLFRSRYDDVRRTRRG